MRSQTRWKKTRLQRWMWEIGFCSFFFCFLSTAFCDEDKNVRGIPASRKKLPNLILSVSAEQTIRKPVGWGTTAPVGEKKKSTVIGVVQSKKLRVQYSKKSSQRHKGVTLALLSLILQEWWRYGSRRMVTGWFFSC